MINIKYETLKEYLILLVRDDIKQQEGYLILQNDSSFLEQTQYLEKIKQITKQELQEKYKYLKLLENQEEKEKCQ